MARLRSALAVFSISCTLTLSAATHIDDPKTFVTDVYRRLIASSSYTPPDDIYSGSVATSNLPVGNGPARVAVRISGGQLEHLVDELILTPNIGPAHPSNLSLPHHVDHFITLNRSSR